MNKMHPAHAYSPYLRNNHYNTTNPSTARSSEQSLPFTFSSQTVWISQLSCVWLWNMAPTSLRPFLDFNEYEKAYKYIWRQATKVFELWNIVKAKQYMYNKILVEGGQHSLNKWHCLQQISNTCSVTKYSITLIITDFIPLKSYKT